MSLFTLVDYATLLFLAMTCIFVLNHLLIHYLHKKSNDLTHFHSLYKARTGGSFQAIIALKLILSVIMSCLLYSVFDIANLSQIDTTLLYNTLLFIGIPLVIWFIFCIYLVSIKKYSYS